MDPEVLLLDEITSALDPPLAAEILRYLRKINETFHIPMMLVTHHVEFARSLATRLLFMKEGKVIVDTPAAANKNPVSQAMDRFRMVGAPSRRCLLTATIAPLRVRSVN